MLFVISANVSSADPRVKPILKYSKACGNYKEGKKFHKCSFCKRYFFGSSWGYTATTGNGMDICIDYVNDKKTWPRSLS